MTPEPIVKAVRYWVSSVPEDHPDASTFTLVVEYSCRRGWAVKSNVKFLAEDGSMSYAFGWDHEPATDAEREAFEREYGDWAVKHYFDEETALRIARENAPKLRYRDYTVADALAGREARDA